MTVQIAIEARASAWEHAKREFPRECCGLVLESGGTQGYFPCRNIAAEKDSFVMHPEDFAKAEDSGEIMVVVHSHCYLPPTPSMADRAACNKGSVPWWIMSLPTMREAFLIPDGSRTPYLEREWSQGTLDCYSLMEDYYLWEHGVVLPNRHELGWVPDFWTKPGLDYFNPELFTRTGFVRVDSPEPEDLLTFNVAARVSNHFAVYRGGNVMLHHLYGKLSSEDVYGGYYMKHTTGIWRLKERVK